MPPTTPSTHIFASPGNLRFPLSGLQKRHIQPERYMTWGLKWFENIWNIKFTGKMLDKNMLF
jgi:hypothetical protein